MQLYAWEKNQTPIYAPHASKQHDYQCIECGGRVRVRGGSHRRHHFYHLQLSPSCRLNGKGMPHLQTQYFLERLLPSGECQLEYRFPEIQRIADVVWLPRKLIFEVQCSPISPEEAWQRVVDYASVGFRVVWILHEECFNKSWVLSHIPHYFTNIDKEGAGMIYDQTTSHRVDMSQPHPLPPLPPHSPPHLLAQRQKDWKLYFSGDLMADYFASPYLERLDIKRKMSKLGFPIPRFYQKFLRMVLESVCSRG